MLMNRLAKLLLVAAFGAAGTDALAMARANEKYRGLVRYVHSLIGSCGPDDGNGRRYHRVRLRLEGGSRPFRQFQQLRVSGFASRRGDE